MSSRVTQVVAEVIFAPSALPVTVTQLVVEAIIPRIARSPATPTGAGVTQEVVEVLFLSADGAARVTQVIVEAIVINGGPVPGGGGGTTSFGYA
jgi:hypothetical protein